MSATILEWVGIIGGILTILTSISVPTFKWYKKKRSDRINRENRIDENMNKISDLNIAVEKIVAHNESFDIKMQNFIDDYVETSTQNLKYMINDAYFCYESVDKIPDDILLNACECCEIYVNKRKKNHEIRPRCELLWAELEHRATMRREHHE